jgi:Uma2 family endonuclease
MSTVSKRLLTPQEYLAQERRAEYRSEYYRGEVFAMSGATFAHSIIKDNLARHAGNQLDGGPCRVITADLRVQVSATSLYTYPDILIVCGEPQFEDAVFDTLLNPQVLLEVLSDSTEKYDRGTKFRHYQKIPSLQEYVLVAQDRPVIDRFVRQADDGWLLTTFADLAETFSFASVPVRIPMAQIYAGVQLLENPDAR